MSGHEARAVGKASGADIESDAVTSAHTLDTARRQNWLANMLGWGSASMACLTVLALLGVFGALWFVPLAVSLLLGLGSLLAKRGAFNVAFWLAFVTLLGGILIRPMITGNLLSSPMFLPMATFFLVLVAERRLRVAVALAGVAALGLLALVTTDENTTPLEWSALTFNGAAISVLAVLLGYLGLEASQSTLILAFLARDRANQLADQSERARRDLARTVQIATRDLRDVLAQTDELVEKLESTSMRDYLTGLYNRRFLDEELPRHIALAKRQGHTLGVAMIDLVKFKEVNDTYSHAVGDQVLTRASEILSESLPDDTILTRYGGDEFIVLAPDSDGPTVERVLRDMQATLSHCDVLSEPPIRISMVFGVALFNGTVAGTGREPAESEPERLLDLASADLQRRRGTSSASGAGI